MNVSVWKKLLEFVETHVLPEEKMYRGETNVRLQDIQSLFDALKGDEKDGPFTDDPKVLSGGTPNPEGDVVNAQYPVDSRVWGRWSRTPDMAAIFGTTKDEPHPGAPRGGTVMKRSYGGRVFYAPGKPSTDHERFGSAMDRYDVMMLGDVEDAPIGHERGVTKFPTSGKPQGNIVVHKIAWSPAIGSTEERQGRLKGLLMGGSASPLRRRPQPHQPTTPDPGRPHDPSDPKHDKFHAFQRRGAGRTAGLPDDPQDVEKFGTAGRTGLGHKMQQHKRKRDED